MADIEDLIAQLEEATEGSFNLDVDICRALDLKEGATLTPFTTSIDGALTLVSEDWLLSLGQNVDLQWMAAFSNVDNAPEYAEFHQGFSMSAPLAICIAALKARSAGNV